MSKKLLIATTNKGKKEELIASIQNLHLSSNLDILTLNDIQTSLGEVKETGFTFTQNALLKASYYFAQTGIPTLADDSGLVVPSLNGEPGVLSARYSGHNRDAESNMTLLLSKLANAPSREAYFQTSLVLYLKSDCYFMTEGYCQGHITLSPTGTQGFGYDPIFYIPLYQKTVGELTPAEKMSISHRTFALKKMQPHLISWIQDAH